jgi:hypothetical protein
MTKTYLLIKRNVLFLCIALFVACLTAKDYTIQGVLKNSGGDKIAKTTILLLDSEGNEKDRTESKSRFGKGKFKFKKVLPGEYVLDVDAGQVGKASESVIITDDDISNVEIVLLKKDTPAGTGIKIAETETEAAAKLLTENKAVSINMPTSDQDYILNELSFEIKKMTAEIKHLNTELKDLKSLSKMWVNPLSIYSKEIILKNGSTVFGKIIYQDEKTLKVETLIGYLIIDRNTVVRVIDNIVMEEQQEYIPEQIRDSYSPPPMPKLAEPKYISSSSLARESGGKHSANCVLMGNISEKKDTQGNIIFSGQIKNIGGRRADFVKVDFVFRKNWSGETKTLTTFLVGMYHTFDSGITTDATLLPGSVGTFELYVPHSFGTFVGYSYVIDWEEYQ